MASSSSLPLFRPHSLSRPPPNPRFSSLPGSLWPSPFPVSALRSNEAVIKQKQKQQRRILESYGLDPDEFLGRPDSSLTKSRRSLRQRRDRRREDGESRDGEKIVLAPEEPKAPRTTHRLLQVLGGTARRKKLLSPKGMDVRPMMEVVKGATFSILQAAGGCPASLRPGRWLDLYSGTGSVGIEAISRGCSEVHFVEMDPWVVSDVLRPNLDWTGFLDVSSIHMNTVENFLLHAEQTNAMGFSFDYISVTPPYTQVDYHVLMDQLDRSPLIGDDCFIVVEYPLKTAMPDSCAHLVKISDRRFGRTNLVIYGPAWSEKKRTPKKASVEVGLT